MSDYAGGFGTLYTADYRPAEGRTVTYRWPDRAWPRTFDAPDATTQVMLRQGLSRRCDGRSADGPRAAVGFRAGGPGSAGPQALADRGNHEAFAELLTLTPTSGSASGEAARALAANGSWSQVADLSGTTKQAAWSRWRTSPGA